MEAISVICKFEQLNEYFIVRQDCRGEMVKFGNINANINYEVVPPSLKFDTVMSTNLYHRRLVRNKYSREKPYGTSN